MISNARIWEKIAQTLVQEHTVSYLPYSSIVRRINVSSVSKQIDNQSLAILSVCKQLDRVTLSGCSNITNSGLMDFLSKGTGNYLLSIDLSDIKCINDETITLIAATCRRLQGLNLSVTSVKEGECMGITDKSIVSLASSCRELRRVS
jgi:F-box and leucine-rich repeat protein GRR1